MPILKHLSAMAVICTLVTGQLAIPFALVYGEETETASTDSTEATAQDSAPVTDTKDAPDTEQAEGEGDSAEDTVPEPEDASSGEIMKTDEDEMKSALSVPDETTDGGEAADEESDDAPSEDTIVAASAEASSTPEYISEETPEILNASSTLTASTTSSTTTLDALVSSTTPATTTPVTDPVISSGSAVAIANILNLVNTNFVNSDGVVLFSNLFESLFGTIDFRSYFNSLLGTSTCSLTSCADDEVTVNLANDASIQNALILQALTGGNTIEANGGNAAIESGDAYAAANIINVANTNLVDSNYLLVTLNAFQDVNGDIVFPSLSEFFHELRTGASPERIDIESTAAVSNNVGVDADSGGNTTENNGDAHTETGDAHGSTNVFNEINTSLIGGQSISVIFRVHGSWAGEIFGAPDDLGWITGEDGSLYLFDVGSGEAHSGGNVSVDADNDALINNNVSVVALTGENHITGADTALISTGDAYAGANIINVANANIVGRNWILAIINIFGDFNGDIAFGRPDLWVGEQVEVPSSIKDGSELTYKTTIINNGDSEASEVVLTDTYKSEYIHILDASLPYTVEEGKLVFALGDLAPGSATEVTYTAKIENAGTGTDITNVVSVEGRETDNNIDDNSDTVTVRTESGGSHRRVERLREQEKEPIAIPIQTGVEIERVSAETVLANSSRASVQSLIVRNTTDAVAHAVILHDILHDPHGNVLEDEVWDFGDILPNEEIEIGYTITFKDDAVPGRYTFFSTIEGTNLTKHVDENGYIDLSAPVAIAEPEPEIAGVSIDIPERPSPLKPEDEESDLLASFIPQALAAETDSTVSEREADLQAYMPYIATIIISLFVIGGAMLRRMRQSLGASD